MISVIIPTYNRADMLIRAVNSVKSQTFTDFEIIVVDDCSTDETPELAIGILRDKDTYIRLDRNSGSSARPRNEGIRAATGKYLTFLDSDDYLDCHCLEKLHDKMINSDLRTGIVYAGVNLVNDQGRIIQRLYDTCQRGYLLHEQLTNCISAVSGSLVRAECFQVCGLFDESYILPHDDMWIRLAKNYKFDYVPGYLAYCLIHDNQYSKRTDRARAYTNILCKHFDVYREYPDALKALYRQIAYQHILAVNRKEFLKYSKLANKDHKPVGYILMLILLINPKLLELINPLYRRVFGILPGFLKLGNNKPTAIHAIYRHQI